jgi:HEAT repeats
MTFVSCALWESSLAILYTWSCESIPMSFPRATMKYERSIRGIRIGTLLKAVAVCAGVLGLGVHYYRAWSPVRHFTQESRPGNPLHVRTHAVLNLSKNVPRSERDEAFRVLLAATQDSDPMVRATAVRALGGRTDRYADCVLILRGLIKDDLSPEVRACAILELKSFVKPNSMEAYDAVPELLAALDDSGPPVRLAAARALEEYGELNAHAKHIASTMARLIREETGVYRLDALYFLNKTKLVPDDMEPTLRGLLNANIPNERIQAKLALILIGVSDHERDAMIRSMLESSQLNERVAAADFLIQVGMRDKGIRALRDLAQSDDSGIRDRAQKLLIEHKGPDEDF